MTLPMALTLSRFGVAPAVLVLYEVVFLPHLPETAAGRGDRGLVAWHLVLLACTLWIEASDLLDGWLARRWGQVTDAGKFLDPLADSVSRSTLFLCFLRAGYVPLWMVALIFWRDAVIGGLRIAGAAQQAIIAARWSGKSKAVIQGIVINVLVAADGCRAAGAYPPLGFLPDFSDLAVGGMGIVTGVTVLSSLDYFVSHRAVLWRLFHSGAGGQSNSSPKRQDPSTLPTSG